MRQLFFCALFLSGFFPAVIPGTDPGIPGILGAQAAVDGRAVMVEGEDGRRHLQQAAFYNRRMERKDFFWFLLEGQQIPVEMDLLQTVVISGSQGDLPGGFRPAEAVLRQGDRLSGAVLADGILFGIDKNSGELIRYSLAYEEILTLTFAEKTPQDSPDGLP